MTPNIAFIDLETAPMEGYFWELWETNVIEVKHRSYVLSFAVQINDGPIKVYALPDYKGYERNKRNDYKLIKDLWKVFDEADIIVAHNGNAFDIRTAKRQFSIYNLLPPSPYKTIDTLKVARKEFKFPSNKLDDLAYHYGIGRKLPHEGKHTWLGCMNGDPKAWATMKRYNKHYIYLLRGIYERQKPWISNHPNLNLYEGGNPNACPTCKSTNLKKQGFKYLVSRKKQQWQCKNCGKWIPGKIVPI